MEAATERSASISGEVDEYDVIVIGAGVTGLYSVHRLREAGLSVRVFEEAPDLGGVWYWNCYPGCRFDTYSPTYSFSFSKELLEEWTWTETYAAQPDVERYLHHVADKFELRRDITFATRVEAASFDEKSGTWVVELSDGSRARSQFLFAAVGRYSTSFVPDVEGIETFEGTWVHTGRWPREGVDLEGKRVAVFGAGATGVQVIPEAAKVASHLTVFQRTANYCLPVGNEPISDEEMERIKAGYDDLFDECEDSPFLEASRPDPRSGLEVSKEERWALYEAMWQHHGTAPKYIPLFYDVLRPGPINEDYAEFVKTKIRERVGDPALADKLVPRNHTFGAKRPPGETEYYEAYARDNVELVDVLENPVVRITPTGIETEDGEYPVDVIIFATGWDVLTGPLLSMDIRGVQGLSLQDKFAEGLRTYLMLQVSGFPNLWILNASVAGSFVRSIEFTVDWIVATIGDMRAHGHRTMMPTPDAEEAWVAYSQEVAARSLMVPSNTFMGGNVPGKPRVPLLPPEGDQGMRTRMRAESDHGYPSFEFG